MPRLLDVLASDLSKDVTKVDLVTIQVKTYILKNLDNNSYFNLSKPVPDTLVYSTIWGVFFFAVVLTYWLHKLAIKMGFKKPGDGIFASSKN